MDLVSPAIAGAVGYVGRWLNAAARASNVALPDLPIDLLHPLEDGEGGLAGLIEASQVDELEEFLSHPATQALLRLSSIAQIARGSAALAKAEIGPEAIARHFAALASSWCEQTSQTWSGAVPELWERITEQQAELLGPVARNNLGSDFADVAVERFFFEPLTSGSTPRHIAVLLRLASSPGRLEEISAIVAHGREQVQRASSDEFDVHGDESTARFQDLYIERSLVDSATGTERSAAETIDPTDHPIRAVVIGDPGTGKSTLVRWFVWNLCREAKRPAAGLPLSVVCREVLASGHSSVLEVLRLQFEREYARSLGAEELEVLLATGSLVVIFDGIDEIQNRLRRDLVVNEIKALEGAFPMTPILCTTRRTGSEVAAFRGSAFRVLSLEQYSNRQVELYAEKWFHRKGHPERTLRFLGESRNLDDLRANPLMLALLCALYSQQDYIPQSRRDVYLRCASLMFREWDPRRGIDIPNIFKNRGDQALQAIAMRLDIAGGYGQTLTQQDAETVVRDVLTRAGVEAVEAQASAKELIDHCATRAWILTAGVGADGDREVRFTHRTFFEFFAAEAKVRNINRQNALGTPPPAPDSLAITPITRAVLEPFWRDPTSVMPELIMQAADDIMGGVSPVVLAELVRLASHQGKSRSSEYVALAVRLLAAAGADLNYASKVLAALADLWTGETVAGRGDAYGMNAFRSLLDIPSAHRAIFRDRVIGEKGLAYEFARRYARLDLAEEVGLYSADWKLLADALPPLSNGADDVLDWWEVQAGKRSPMLALKSGSGRSVLRVRSDSVSRPGVFWDWLASAPVPPDGESIRVQKMVQKKALIAPRDEPMIDVSLVPSEPIAGKLRDGCLSVDLALLLMVLTRGEHDRLLSRLAGLDLGSAAEALREARQAVSLVDFESRDHARFAGVRAEVRRSYSLVAAGSVPTSIWRLIGLR